MSLKPELHELVVFDGHQGRSDLDNDFYYTNTNHIDPMCNDCRPIERFIRLV